MAGSPQRDPKAKKSRRPATEILYATLYSSNGTHSDSGLRPQLTAPLCDGGPVAQLPEGHCGCREDEGVQSHGMEH